MLEPHISTLVSQGLQFHQRGDLASAEQRYLAILAREPQHSDALHLLGVLKGQLGQHAIGLELIKKAIAQSPRENLAHMFLPPPRDSVKAGRLYRPSRSDLDGILQ